METVNNYLLILILLTIASLSSGHHSHFKNLRDDSGFNASIEEEGHKNQLEDESEGGKGFGTDHNDESLLRKPFWNSFRLSRQFSANRSLFFKPKTRPPVIVSPSLDLKKKSSRGRPFSQVRKDKYKHETVNSTSTFTRLSPTTEEKRLNQSTTFTTISPLVTAASTRSADITSTMILTTTSGKSSEVSALTSDRSAETLVKKLTTASTPIPAPITTLKATQSGKAASMTIPTPMTKLLVTGTVLTPTTELIMFKETEASVESTTGLFTGSLLTLNDPIDLF